MPSPLFNALFLTALIIPAAMYITGMIILIASLVLKHYRATAVHTHHVEATAH
jgi:multisubunit Na+/H+ antiporter MnhC subunit